MKQNTKELLNKLLYERLIIIRSFYNVSQKRVAEFLNISIKTYSNWENGKATPDIMILKTLVTDFFQIPLDFFLNEHIPIDVLISISSTNFKLPKENRQAYCSTLETKNIVKERLPLLRQMNGMSTQLMADKLNVTMSEYLKWEKGTVLVDAIMLKNIVTDILSYSIDDFLDITLPIEKLRRLQINAIAREKALQSLVSDKLPKLRENANLTPDELATYLGVDRNLYIEWEKGYKLIDVLSLKKLSWIYFILRSKNFWRILNRPIHFHLRLGVLHYNHFYLICRNKIL